MGRRRKPHKVALTLEQQLQAMGARPAGAIEPPKRWLAVEPWMGAFVSAAAIAQVSWDQRARDLREAIRWRDVKRMRDTGPDVSGNYHVSPFLVAKGHSVEIAPKHLKADGDSILVPERITSQRMIDLYRNQGRLTKRQHRAAERLYRIWRNTGREAGLTASYSPDPISGTFDPDRKMVGRTDGVIEWEECQQVCRGLSFSVLVDVIVWNKSAADWARDKGHSTRVSAEIGMAFLRAALDALVGHFRY